MFNILSMFELLQMQSLRICSSRLGKYVSSKTCRDSSRKQMNHHVEIVLFPSLIYYLLKILLNSASRVKVWKLITMKLQILSFSNVHVWSILSFKPIIVFLCFYTFIPAMFNIISYVVVSGFHRLRFWQGRQLLL